MLEVTGIKGIVTVALWRPDNAGKLQLIDEETINNLVTQYGDQFYGEKAAGIGSHAAPTGMRLGTGTTAAAKTGAGAAIVTYITGSQKAFEGGYPASSIPASARRISYQCIWAAGTATNSAITEAVVTNESPLTNVAGAVGNTISRVVFTAKDKQAADTLTITWHHDLLGA